MRAHAVWVAVAFAGCMGNTVHEHPEDPSVLSRDVTGLPRSEPAREEDLPDGATFNLVADEVAHDPGTGQLVRMFAYNGQIPGPLLRVPQGSHVTIAFENRLDFSTTVHWHGIRLDAANDGVPHVSQDPVPPGGAFRYEVEAPDEGPYWYHAHVREDLQQELGLAGVLLVDGPRAPSEAWPRQDVLVLDDMLLIEGDVAPYSTRVANHVLMGRFGNTLRVTGGSTYEAQGAPGERLRLVLVNVANVRPFQLWVEGATRVEWIGSDGGYLEAPKAWNGSITLAPAERRTIDVILPPTGQVTLMHRTTEREALVARWTVAGEAVGDGGAPEGPHARARESLAAAHAHVGDPVELSWELSLRVRNASLGLAGGHHHHHGNGPPSTIEWEDGMADLNALTTSDDLEWILRDVDTFEENMEMQPVFERGSWVKLQLRNLGTSVHPMQHPIHVHGQRFVVTSVNGVPNPDLVWRDTVLVEMGQRVTILIELTNPGTWLVHCHISEHMESGMMTTLRVT